MSGRDYTPKPGAIERQYGDVQQDYDLSLRTRLVTTANPWLKRDAAALEALVTAPVDNATLTENAGALYGMVNADKLIGNFRKMGAATQRAMYGTLTPGQQQVLQQGGYKPPDDDGESFLRRVAGPVGGVVGDVMGTVAGAVGTVASPALDAMVWLGDQPAHIYRTIRQGDDRSQWVALGGAIVGTVAAVAATAGSGGTFATLGAAGGGALLGGSLGSAATNPSDFIEAFNASWNGEKTFDRPSLRKAEELLGDSRYTNLAADIANATDMPIIDLARALAGQRDVSINSQWAAVEGVIGRFAQKNTPEYQELALKVSTLLQAPMFQEAITTLQNGKISVGRDFADQFFDPGTGMHQLVSGAVDGTWQVVMDPTLLIGKGAQAWKMQRTAIGVLTAENAAAAANRFRSISDNIGSVRRMHEVVADAVSTGNFNRIRTLAPETAELWMPLQDYRIDLLTKGVLKEGEEFTRKHFLDFVTNQQHMIPLMQGYGTVRGAKGVVLRGLNPEWASFRQMASKVRSFTHGLTDVRAEQELGLMLDELGDDALRQVIPPSLFSELNDPTLRRSVWTTGDEEILRNTPWLWHEPNVAAREAGRKLAVVPGLSKAADALTAMTTMIPVGKSISIVGKHAGRDVHALTELGRYMGMPAYTRKMWAEQILNARSPGVAMNLVTGWLDNALTTAGLRYDDEASAMVDKFLSSFHQAYSGGVTDNLVRDGRTTRVSVFMSEQATDIVMPNLQELRQLASGGFLAKLVGLTDMSVAQAGVNKFWKPGVLLRQGFVLRAAGEEMTNFMLRGGYGSMAQEFGARSIAHRNLYEAAVAKRDLGQWRLITDAEHEALAVGPALAHLRPLERMLARYDFTAPISGKIRQYSDWMRDELTYGVALRPSAEKQAGRLERVDNLLSGIAGQSFDDATRAVERGATSLRSAAGGAPLTLEQKLRANLAANANALMFGNQHSWRRMLYGGVHDDLLQAADAFAEQFATVMAREVGALNNGPADIDRADTIKYRTQDSTAPEGYRDVEYVQLRGQRRRVSSATKDPWYANGVHEQTQRVVGDPLTRDLVTRHLPFVRGGASATDEHIRQTVAAYSSINSRTAKEIVNEFLGAPSREGLLALAERYKSIDPEIARVLREAVGYGDVVFDDVLDAFLRADPKKFTSGLRTRTQRYADSKAPGGFRDVETTTQEGLHYIIADLKRAKEDIVSVLDSYAPTVDTARRGAEGYDEASRRFLGQLLRSSDGPGGISMADIERGYRVNSIDEDELLSRFLDGDPTSNTIVETIDELVKSGTITPADADGYVNDILHDGGDATAAMERLRTAAQDRVQQGRLPVFYDSFNDVEEQLMVTARSLLNDPKYQGTVNLSRRYDDASEGFERGQVQLWEAPSIRPKTTGELPSFEDVVALAPDRGLILDKRDEVEAWLEAAATAEPTDILFAADRGLAEQLAVIDARWRKAPQPQPVRTANVNRQILDGRFHKNEGLLTPAFKRGSDTRLWTASRRAFNDRMFDPSTVGDGLLEETARAMVDTIRQTWTRGTVETVSPRYTKDVIDEATGEITGVASMYFKEVDGSLTPVPRGTKLRGNESVYDAKGKRLDVLDFRVSQPTDVVTGESGQIMWELTGPMMEDAWDDIAGTRLFLPKDAVKTSIGQALPANDVVPVFRSRVGHVQGTQGLPNITRAEVMAPAKSSTWDNVVRFGFDKVLGPQIEAIARRPMAFHFFQQRYTQNRQWLNVLRDPVVVNKMNKAALALEGKADFIIPVLENTRSLARFDGVAEAATWTDQQTMAFLRGMGADEYAAFLTRSKAKYKTASAKAGRTPEIIEVDVALTKMRRVSHDRIVANLHTGATGDELLAMVRSEIGSHALTNKQVFESGKIQEKIDGSEILSKLTDEQWEALRAGEINYRHAHQAAGEYAAEAAINDMMPFIDSHELRTQFAEHGKGLLPFWYAEENFLKRWGRTIALDPTSIRKAQLTYMGLKNSGVVRTDSQGNQYFVYPGSNLLHEAFSKIPFLPSLLPGSGSTMFQSPVESMLPGVNSRFGTPSFSPLVAVPMGMVTTMFPELNPIERALIGDIGAASTGWADVVKQVAPAHIRHTLGAIFNANENTNTRLASAMSAAIAHLEANDQGLPDDADAGQVDAYLDKVRNHSRIIVFSQALSGWINPGTTGTLDTGSDNGIMGFGTDDPRGVLNDLYVTMIDNLGMEQGTIEFLKTYPLADLEDIVNPMTPEDVLAYTTGTSVTTSGAQLPATEQALNFWEINDDYLKQFPSAGAWLLPQAENGTERSDYAYQQQLISGMRKKRTPDEFLRAIKFKQAGNIYFDRRSTYLTAVEEAREAGDKDLVTQYNNQWDLWSRNFKAAHPLFTEELESSDGRQRRAQTIDEMRTILADPNIPDVDPTQLQALRLGMQSFTNYEQMILVADQDRSANGRDKKEAIKKRYSEYMDTFTKENPSFRPFWISVLRPAAGLD